MLSRIRIPLVALMSAVFLLGVLPAFAQSNKEIGKLKVHVSPKQAYVFVDGNAIRDGSQTIALSTRSEFITMDTRHRSRV